MRITGPYQLDHILADAATARERLHIWRVLPEPARALKLSDHAPTKVGVIALVYEPAGEPVTGRRHQPGVAASPGRGRARGIQAPGRLSGRHASTRKT